MTPEEIVVHGGAPLLGELTVSGSKNAALPLIAAALAVPAPVEVERVPDCSDVGVLARLAAEAGLGADWEAGRGVFTAEAGPAQRGPGDLVPAARIRASYYLVPALLAAHRQAHLPWPGGCDVGPRGMDQHFAVYRAFGDEAAEETAGYRVTAGRRRGPVRLELAFRSRGATIAAVLRAVTSRRRLTLSGPNPSPEARAVLASLKAAGYPIAADEHELRLHADHTPDPGGVRWAVPGDKIEAATLLAALAITGGHGSVHGIDPADVEAFTCAVRRLGWRPEAKQDGIALPPGPPSRAEDVTFVGDLEPGGHDADFEPLLMALALHRGGVHLFGDAINPRRHSSLITELGRFGARVQHRTPTLALVSGGPQGLRPTQAHATDIRTGTAVLLAALSAPGASRITGADQIGRGHDDLPGRLRALGARIDAGAGVPS